jgi:hypothetical protein
VTGPPGLNPFPGLRSVFYWLQSMFATADVGWPTAILSKLIFHSEMIMKKLLYGQLLLVIATLSSGSGAKRMPVAGEPSVRIAKASTSGTIAIEVGNSSNETLRVWDESNTWGADRWRVLRIRNGQIETFFQNPHQVFTANFPRFNEIAPKGHLDRTLDLNGGDWCTHGKCSSFNEHGIGGQTISFEADDMVIVVFRPTKLGGCNQA